MEQHKNPSLKDRCRLGLAAMCEVGSLMFALRANDIVVSPARKALWLAFTNPSMHAKDVILRVAECGRMDGFRLLRFPNFDAPGTVQNLMKRGFNESEAWRVVGNAWVR